MKAECRQQSGTVALIQMPFAVASWPSLALSLLKSGLAERGLVATVHYLNLLYMESIGADAYEELALGHPSNCDLLGEWIFSQSLSEHNPANETEYLNKVLRGGDSAHRKTLTAEQIDRHVTRALHARSAVPAFLDRCVEEVDWAAVLVAGFTSVFQQHAASLALAKRLKQEFPHLTIIFGGANCEGAMGQVTLDRFPFVDAICSGEGDRAFPEFIERLQCGDDPIDVAGISTRPKVGRELRVLGGAPSRPSEMVADLDQLPFPDFKDFFEAAARFSSAGTMALRMVFETSRGCWWGQKHHCTFCGLNGSTMAFRYKTAGRAILEIRHLVEAYGMFTKRVSAADNIMPLDYFQTFLPQLEALDLDLDLFYETKSNLTEAQVAQYQRAGLSQIQPGIESMSSSILSLMRKGVSALQNIQLLKWCAQYGIRAHWNYLYGFPGEEAAHYEGQAELLSKLSHLMPPVGCAPVRFDRFSPYHNNPDEFGLSHLRPYPAYKYVYPGFSGADLERIAYYFVAEFQGQELMPTYATELVRVMTVWKERADSSTLCHSTHAGQTIVFDGRTDGDMEILLLDGTPRDVLNRCAAITSERSLVSEFGAAAAGAIQLLVALGLVIREGDRYLTISVPLGFAYTAPEQARNQILKKMTWDAESGPSEIIRIPVENCTVFR
jgi:ribosomal peptide maturation radical SAM protein 1